MDFGRRVSRVGELVSARGAVREGCVELADVRHLRESDELLEVHDDEPRAIVREDAWSGGRIVLLRALDRELDVRLGQLRAESPVHDDPAAVIELRT